MMACQINEVVGDRFPMEQVALRKGIWGCTHAHILDQTVVKDAERYKKEMHMLWVDMTKAFDSLSHGAIKWIAHQWGIASSTRRLLSTIMSFQTVRYYGYADSMIVRSRPLKIRNGLMQGDSLSSLLFCLTIAPLSSWIRRHVSPYQTKFGSEVNSDGPLRLGHIFYMDDLKVYTSDWSELTKAKTGIQGVARQVGLELNLRKCGIRSMNSASSDSGALAETGPIPVLGGAQVYKYLGAEQTSLISIDDLWDRAESSARAVAKRLFLSNLTVRQKVDGYNQVVVPKLKYAFSCVIFGVGRLSSLRMRARRFDVSVRRLMEQSRMRFGNSCSARLYVSEELGGLGMKLVEQELDLSITYTWCYLASNADFLVSYRFAESLKASTKRSLISDFQAVLTANGLEGRVRRSIIATVEIDGKTFFNATEAARSISHLIRERWSQTLLEEWKSKMVASRVLQERGLDGKPTGLCLKDSFLWSAKGWVSSTVLRNVWGVQEASLLTRCSAAGRALMPSARGLCRMSCGPNAMETAEHIVSACPHWRTNIMVERHDDVARVLYHSIRMKYGITTVVNTHVPHVVDVQGVVIHWNDSIFTSEGLKNNRPDLLVWDKRAQRIWIIEISIAWFTRVLTQEQRKSGKYGVNSTLAEDTEPGSFYPGPNLKAALQRDRKCRVDVVPIVVGACGEVTPNLRRNVEALLLPDKTDTLIERIQQAAILGTNRLVKCHLAN